MTATVGARWALTCTALAVLACGEGPGVRQDTGSGELVEISESEGLMSEAHKDRRVDYIEFVVTDIEAAKQFYGAVFGWEFTDYGPDYSSFSDGRLDGGFRIGSEVTAGGTLVVMYATNLEEVEAAIVANGGRIVQPTFEFPGGRRFHFTDPSGNELAVWSDR